LGGLVGALERLVGPGPRRGWPGPGGRAAGRRGVGDPGTAGVTHARADAVSGGNLPPQSPGRRTRSGAVGKERGHASAHGGRGVRGALPDEVPPHVRLRQWLKSALRAGRFRAVSVQETMSYPDGAPAEALARLRAVLHAEVTGRAVQGVVPPPTPSC